MKRIMVFLSLVGLLLTIGAGIANAQSVHPQDVLRSTLRHGDPFGPGRYQRCQAALRNGWGNASSCGVMVVPRYARGYNQRRGGFFGRGSYDGYRDGGYYDSNGRWWAPVVGEGIRTVGDVVMNGQNNNTIRQVEGQRVRLDDKRIDNQHEIDLRHEDRADRGSNRADARLQVELEQLRDGRYVAREVGTVSQPIPILAAGMVASWAVGAAHFLNREK